MTGPTTQVALFDTNGGFLQWIGQAAGHEAAIRAHLQDVGYDSGIEFKFLAIDVTDAQAAALRAWADAGSKAPDYPEGMDRGVRYDADEVAEIMRTR